MTGRDLPRDGAFGKDEHIGAEALHGARRWHDVRHRRSSSKKVPGKTVVGLRILSREAEPIRDVPSHQPLEGAVSVEAVQSRRMLIAGCLARAVVEQRIASDAELRTDEVQHLLRIISPGWVSLPR